MKIENNVLIKVKSSDLAEGRFVVIPDSVLIIGQGAFARCYNLTSVAIHLGVTRIERAAFIECLNLSSVSLPASLTAIGQEAFWLCTDLSTVIIPQGVTSIGKSAFFGCQKLTTMTIPQGVTRIEEGTFWGCSNLHSVSLPEGLTAIDNNAFRLCENLNFLVIPQGVVTIGSEVFSFCEKLMTLILPQGVTIDPSALNDCHNLSIIVINADTPDALNLVKNQLTSKLHNKVFSKEEYEVVRQLKYSILQDIFKELLATNKISSLSTQLSPITKHSFFSLLPDDLLHALNFYKHATYTNALLTLPDLNIPIYRDKHGAIDCVDYQTRFKSKFTKVLHTILMSPTPEQAKVAPSDVSARSKEPLNPPSPIRINVK